LVNIVIGSDHIGYQLKKAVIEHLSCQGILVEDIGPYCEDIPVDYPDYAEKVAWSVVRGEFDYGVVICGTGIGVSVAANKIPGAIAALCFDTNTAHQARAYNDANILAMGAWIVNSQSVVGILEEWLKTPFEKGRHVPRVERLKRGFSVEDKTKNHTTSFISDLDIQLGISLSINETSFGPLLFAGHLKEGIKNAARYGFNLVEISVRQPEDFGQAKVESLLEQYGVTISTIATGQGCIHDGLCLSASDAELRELAVQRMKILADYAADFGADLIIGGVRGRFTGSQNEQQKQRFKAVEAIQQVVHYASDRGVTVLLEPINRYETNFINTMEQGRILIEEIGETNLKLLPDTFHMNIEEIDMAETLRKSVELIGCVHFADSNRHAPGQGHIDFRSVMNVLVEIDYCGPIICEILPLPDDASAMQNTADFFGVKRAS